MEQAFSCFVSFLANEETTIGKDWHPSVVYEVLMTAVGEDLSNRKIPKAMLDYSQVWYTGAVWCSTVLHHLI